VAGVHTLLVANRGEIARRVTRTARELGLRCVAVHAEDDRDEPFVREADVAVALPGRSAAETYLHVPALLAAAEATGADAVHPGYGFLSEQAHFARAVIDAGLTWVGPHPDAIAAMGDKLAAKRLAAEVGVPLPPSARLEGDEPFEWRRQADAVGYPLLVKASAGGGGRGMRPVADAAGLAAAVHAARREAAAAFGDATVFAERHLPRARHVEIQVAGDRHGRVIHLGERECSVQRRHQKLIEEAPSPAVDADLRARMGAAAVRLAEAIDYDSVGTVEFLLDDRTGEFFFLEMNTRLQVEHPVTEAVTGVDLVRLQLALATGAPLPLTQDDVELVGHAIEARVYAEDPARDWLPSVGRVHRYEHGRTPGLRYDDGVDTGSVVGPHFDALLTKVVAHARTRTEAAARLARGLTELRIHGPTTNRDHLVAVLRHEDFLEGRTTTTFVDEHPELLDAGPGPAARTAHLLAAALVGRHRRTSTGPWPFAPGGWRNVGRPHQEVAFAEAGAERRVRYRVEPDGRITAEVDGVEVSGRLLEVAHDHVRVELGGLTLGCDVHVVGETSYVNSPGGQSTLVILDRFPTRGPERSAGGPTAPLPGRVTSVEVAVGDRVAAGATLVVMEAMKVEHRISATSDARVVEVLVAPGDVVDAHQVLVRLEDA
jgi:acetyl/propionyl-CoA carboxylase alpha subunit